MPLFLFTVEGGGGTVRIKTFRLSLTVKAGKYYQCLRASDPAVATFASLGTRSQEGEGISARATITSVCTFSPYPPTLAGTHRAPWRFVHRPLSLFALRSGGGM